MLLFVVYVYSILYTINYIVYCIVKRWERYKHIAFLLLPLLLLLIVIYDGVGTYDEMIIMDWGLVC